MEDELWSFSLGKEAASLSGCTAVDTSVSLAGQLQGEQAVVGVGVVF